MQSLETKGQFKVAAAKRPKLASYWNQQLTQDLEKSTLSPDNFSTINRNTKNITIPINQNLFDKSCAE